MWHRTPRLQLGISSFKPSLLSGTNYAFGGATTGGTGASPSLLDQASLYLAHNAASANALYVIEGGGNDARAAFSLIQEPARPFGPTVMATAAAFAANVGTIVDELKSAGAQHIVVWDTPNLALSPAVAAPEAQTPLALSLFLANQYEFGSRDTTDR